MRTNQETDRTYYFHGCPDCPLERGPDEFFAAGRTDIGVCHDHRTSWVVATNLDLFYRGETLAEQEVRYRPIQDYRQVDEPGEETMKRANQLKSHHPEAGPA